MVFFHALSVGGDGGAFDADVIFFDGFGSLDGDLVVGLIAGRQAEVIVFGLEVDEGQEQLVFDLLPDDKIEANE